MWLSYLERLLQLQDKWLGMSELGFSQYSRNNGQNEWKYQRVNLLFTPSKRLCFSCKRELGWNGKGCWSRNTSIKLFPRAPLIKGRGVRALRKAHKSIFRVSFQFSIRELMGQTNPLHLWPERKIPFRWSHGFFGQLFAVLLIWWQSSKGFKPVMHMAWNSDDEIIFQA